MTAETAPDREPRLYGIPDAENMYLSLAEAYESQVDGQEGNDPAVIEEWTAVSAMTLVQSAASIIEGLIEQVADGAPDGLYDSICHLDAYPVVLAAAEALRDALADKVPDFYLADKRVAEHRITWDDQGENPMDCGQPIYHPSAS